MGIIYRLFNENKKKKKIEFIKNTFNLSDSFIDAVYSSKLEHIIKLFNTKNSKKDFDVECYLLLKNSKINNYEKSFLYSGIITGRYNGTSIYLTKEEYERFVKNDYSLDEINCIKNTYKDDLYNYILNNNYIKNELLHDKNDTIDLTMDYSYDLFRKDYDSLNKEVLLKLFLSLLSFYNKEDLLNNQEFVRFELKNNIFRKNINMNLRKEEYKKYKNLSSECYLKIKNKPLLSKRLNLVNSSTDDIDFLDYEILYRKDLVNRLFTPSESLVIDDFKNVKPMLLHFFKRDVKKALYQDGVNDILNEIIENRTVNKRDLIKYPLSNCEEVYFKSRCKYLDEVLLNEFIVEKAYDNNFCMHSERDGLFLYKSNSINQISTHLITLKDIINYHIDTYGIGFDSSTPFENIILSSSKYLTTNKGIYNLDYTSDDFSMLSNCYQELLEKGYDSEVLLMRNGEYEDTKANYIFYFMYDMKKKEEVIRHANELGLKLITFDIKKIKNSYLEDNNKHL